MVAMPTSSKETGPKDGNFGLTTNSDRPCMFPTVWQMAAVTFRGAGCRIHIQILHNSTYKLLDEILKEKVSKWDA